MTPTALRSSKTRAAGLLLLAGSALATLALTAPAVASQTQPTVRATALSAAEAIAARCIAAVTALVLFAGVAVFGGRERGQAAKPAERQSPEPPVEASPPQRRAA